VERTCGAIVPMPALSPFTKRLSKQDTGDEAREFLSFEPRLIERNHHNRCPVSTSLAQAHLYQSYTRHSVLTGHLPQIPNAGTMCEALG
jgi:hypothetical protein